MLLLTSCHVFEEAVVQCTTDLPCASGGGDADADTDADTDTDTATDTGEEPGEPTLGWAISLVGGTSGRVRVYEPVNREIIAEWSAFGTIGGMAYYQPADLAGVLLSDEDILLLNSDGTTTSQGGGLGNGIWDATRLGNKGALAYEGGVVSFDAALNRTTELVPQGTFTTLQYIGGSNNLAYFSDPATGGPDLYSVSTDGTYGLLIEDYDSSTTRGVNVFSGVDGEAFACSTAGAVYAINDLVDGERSPYAYYDGGLTDVETCDWDAGSKQFLLYSPTMGIYRMDATGAGEQVFAPPGGYSLHRVYFYEAG